MQAKRYTLLLSLWMYASILLAQTNLTVLDPRRGNWTQQQGTIDEATFVTHPEGIYTAVDMYLTFSARGTSFQNPFDTLEVVFNFTLPDNAIINDSWLWIDTVIVKADIFDRWTASTIYENIVQRRQDPSILFKEGNGKYQLRIFPMVANKSRKVKISYLTTAQWGLNQVTTPLPIELLQVSRIPVFQVTVRTKHNDKWQQPSFVNTPDIVFTEQLDNGVNYWQAVLKTSDLNRKPLLTYVSPLREGVYVNHLPEGDGGIYQLVFLPKEVFGLEAVAPQKMMILLDYVVGYTPDVSATEVLNRIKQQLLTTLTPRDSFNFIVSKLVIKPLSEHWLPATPQAIEAAFATLSSNPSSGYSNLPAMLGAAIDYIQNADNEGSILLFANSANLSTVETANSLINDLRTEMNGDPIPVYINDFQQVSFNYYWAGNQYFRGNEYFYTNLARFTTGHYVNLFDCCKTFSDNISETFGAATSLTGSLDLYTRLQNGLCHSRFNLNSTIESVNYNQPVYQVGKYEGNFPFIIEAVGNLNGNLVSTQVKLESNELADADTLSREIWFGNHIQALERLEQTNSTISKIISESLDERVLSRYTAFLALEPAQGGTPCLNCEDESGGPTVGVDDLDMDSLLTITAAPNPFKDQIKLILQFKEAQNLTDYQFAIYNMVGQQVKVFNDLSNTTPDRVELTWEADKTVASGIYFFVAQTPQGRHSLKIVKL